MSSLKSPFILRVRLLDSEEFLLQTDKLSDWMGLIALSLLRRKLCIIRCHLIRWCKQHSLRGLHYLEWRSSQGLIRVLYSVKLLLSAWFRIRLWAISFWITLFRYLYLIYPLRHCNLLSPLRFLRKHPKLIGGTFSKY